MYRLLWLIPFLFSQGPVSADALREVSFQGADLAPTNTAPTFDHGYVAVYDVDKINIYSPDGTFAFSFAPPHGGLTVNVAVDADGTVAAAAGYVPPDFGPGIAVMDRTGALQTYIATQPYSPTQVCFAPDHSIWAIGNVRQADTPEYFVFRHYSREGKQLGAFLPTSSLEKAEGGEPAMFHVGAWSIRVANNRVGAYLHYGDRKKWIWLEFSLDGKELGRWTFPDGFDGMPRAFTQSGAVYTRGALGISLLDHASGAWNPVAPPSEGILLGAFGDDLVFWLRDQARLRYVPVSQ